MRGCIAVPRFISCWMGSDTAMDDTVLGLSRVEVVREGDSSSSDIGELLVIKAEWLDASTEIHVQCTLQCDPHYRKFASKHHFFVNIQLT